MRLNYTVACVAVVLYILAMLLPSGKAYGQMVSGGHFLALGLQAWIAIVCSLGLMLIPILATSTGSIVLPLLLAWWANVMFWFVVVQLLTEKPFEAVKEGEKPKDDDSVLGFLILLCVAGSFFMFDEKIKVWDKPIETMLAQGNILWLVAMGLIAVYKMQSLKNRIRLNKLT